MKTGCAWRFQTERSSTHVDVPSPPSFSAWSACWKVFRACLFMLRHPPPSTGALPRQVATSASLEEYTRTSRSCRRNSQKLGTSSCRRRTSAEQRDIAETSPRRTWKGSCLWGYRSTPQHLGRRSSSSLPGIQTTGQTCGKACPLLHCQGRQYHVLEECGGHEPFWRRQRSITACVGPVKILQRTWLWKGRPIVPTTIPLYTSCIHDNPKRIGFGMLWVVSRLLYLADTVSDMCYIF